MINSVGSVNSSNYTSSAKEQANIKADKNQNTSEETGVIVDIGNNTEKSPNYSKPASAKLNAEEINKLWQEANRATDTLRKLVEDLIGRQGKKAKDILSGNDTLVVDDQARAEAQKMISEDGEFGVKAVSTRIVSFAKAVSGGDKSKIGELKEAIINGFKQAESALGGSLPDISKKTYDAVMEELDNWEKEE